MIFFNESQKYRHFGPFYGFLAILPPISGHFGQFYAFFCCFGAKTALTPRWLVPRMNQVSFSRPLPPAAPHNLVSWVNQVKP